jgi:hypothetical protein
MSLKQAIFKIQCAVSKVEKDGTNPHTKSGYPTLEAVLDVLNPLLAEHFLVIEQFTQRKEYGWVLITEISTADGKESQFVETPLLGIEDGKNQMQALGSAITYARRYTLMAKFKLTPTDDDGHAAGKSAPELNFVKPGGEKAPLPPSSPKEFRIPEGKYKGKKVSEIEPSELKQYITSLDSGARESGRKHPKWFLDLKKASGL